MTLQAPAAHGADTRRHKIVGDVHLILLNPAGEVLFGQRHNTGYEDGAWHVPSGHLEAGESVVAALIREASEETGIVIAERDVEFAHVMHNSSSGGRAAFFFTVQRWAGTPENREPDKCKALQWFPLGALPEHMIGYCRAALAGHPHLIIQTSIPAPRLNAPLTRPSACTHAPGLSGPSLPPGQREPWPSAALEA